MGTMSGDAGGALAVSLEFDDYASYGKFTDAMMADPEGLKMLTSIGTDENPIVSYQQSVWSVIDA
jgi:hypothetical protein